MSPCMGTANPTIWIGLCPIWPVWLQAPGNWTGQIGQFSCCNSKIKQWIWYVKKTCASRPCHWVCSVASKSRRTKSKQTKVLLSCLLMVIHIFCAKKYRKIPKISPSMYKPPKLVTQKTFREIAPPNISPCGGLYLEIAVKYKVKQRKNGEFSTIRPAQLILKSKFPFVDKPLQK